MAKRMTSFIRDNYPKPLPVNYTAVSKYMWIEIGDCVKMASLLRGEMTWTDEVIAQVVKLREQGMLNKDIARQLSPALSAKRVSNAYCNHTNQQAYTPLSDEEKLRVKEMANVNAEQMSFLELRKLVLQKMPHVCQMTVYSHVEAYAITLHVFKERLRNADIDQIASQILNGTRPSKLATQLGIPSVMLTKLLKSSTLSMYSSTWTQQETEKLLELVRTNTRPHNWKPISEEIGTRVVSSAL